MSVMGTGIARPNDTFRTLQPQRPEFAFREVHSLMFKVQPLEREKGPERGWVGRKGGRKKGREGSMRRCSVPWFADAR